MSPFPVPMGSRDERTEKERWLDWAQRAEWRFESYYKYGFIFTATGYLWHPIPAGPLPDAADEFTATLAVGGDSSAIYRYDVRAEPMTWQEVIACGWYGDDGGAPPSLTVRKADRTLLFTTNPYVTK